MQILGPVVHWQAINRSRSCLRPPHRRHRVVRKRWIASSGTFRLANRCRVRRTSGSRQFRRTQAARRPRVSGALDRQPPSVKTVGSRSARQRSQRSFCVGLDKPARPRLRQALPAAPAKPHWLPARPKLGEPAASPSFGGERSGVRGPIGMHAVRKLTAGVGQRAAATDPLKRRLHSGASLSAVMPPHPRPLSPRVLPRLRLAMTPGERGARLGCW